MLAADDALKRAELESQKWRKRDLGPTQEKRAKVRKKVQEQTENIWKQTKAVRKLSEIKHTQYLGQVELLKKQIADQQQKLANRQHMIENQKQFLDDLVPQLALLVQDQPNADPKPEDQSAMQQPTLTPLRPRDSPLYSSFNQSSKLQDLRSRQQSKSRINESR